MKAAIFEAEDRVGELTMLLCLVRTCNDIHRGESAWVGCIELRELRS